LGDAVKISVPILASVIVTQVQFNGGPVVGRTLPVAHPFLLPSSMASTLCVTARDGLLVVPGIANPFSGPQEVPPNQLIVSLVKEMRATCLDVAESAAQSEMQLLNPTIYVARALKLYGTLKLEHWEVPELPADQARMTWANFSKYTEDRFASNHVRAQECTLVRQFVIASVHNSIGNSSVL